MESSCAPQSMYPIELMSQLIDGRLVQVDHRVGQVGYSSPAPGRGSISKRGETRCSRVNLLSVCTTYRRGTDPHVCACAQVHSRGERVEPVWARPTIGWSVPGRWRRSNEQEL